MIKSKCGSDTNYNENFNVMNRYVTLSFISLILNRNSNYVLIKYTKHINRFERLSENTSKSCSKLIICFVIVFFFFCMSSDNIKNGKQWRKLAAISVARRNFLIDLLPFPTNNRSNKVRKSF